MSKETKNTLSIYLIKEDIVDKADILIEDVEPLEQPNNRFIYYKNSKSDVPTWVKSFFKDEETLVNKLFNSSSRAIILRRIQVDEEGNERIFAIPFGYGKYLLKDDVIEERFGLKEDYLLAMERSPIKDLEIKSLLNEALTNKVNDRLVYIKGIDASYSYEGYNTFKTDSLI